MSKAILITNPLTGEAKTTRAWAAAIGISAPAMYQRIAEQWPAEKLFAKSGTFKLRSHGDRRPVYELDGETKTLNEWAKVHGVQPFTVGARLRRGWDVKEAITTPTEWTCGRGPTQYTFKGETKTLVQWAKEFSPVVSPLTLDTNIRRDRRNGK